MDPEIYRKMLIDISDRITEDNFRSMKYLCSDNIPKRRLAEVTDVTSLWEALEEANMINKDDTAFINTLLTNACQSRVDLLTLYKQYISMPAQRKPIQPKNDPEQTLLQNLQPEFDVIVANIGRDWRMLARKLGLSEGDLDYVTDLHSTNLREQCREALKIWLRLSFQLKGLVEINRRTLVSALEKCEKRALAHKVDNLS